MTDSYGKAREWCNLLPDESLDVCEENLELFFQTMYERQEIWYKRFILKQPSPWTENEIFANYKFTNVYRELDRNSQYLIHNVILKETNRKELIWKILFFRYFNNPNTNRFFESVKPEWVGGVPSIAQYDQDEHTTLIQYLREAGENPFTNAYLINSMACPGKTRDWCYTQNIIPTLHRKIDELNMVLLKSKTPEDIVKYLLSLPGVANFIAHEFYQDFTYVPIYTNKKLMQFDQNDWTNVGPGADLGIRLIFPSLKRKDKINAIYWLRDLSSEYLAKYGDFKYLNWDKEKGGYYVTPGVGSLSLHPMEMYLCEFQKYWKMMIKEGKQRSKFIPKTIVK